MLMVMFTTSEISLNTFSVCLAGSRDNGTNCVLCGEGTYNGQLNQTSCQPCGANQTTSTAGATSSDDCGKYQPNQSDNQQNWV